MIEFSIPNFKTKINVELIKLMESKPYMFNEDCKIVSAYDSFTCIWNGGRIKQGERPTKEEIVDNLNFWNSRGISVIYTFTNMLIEEEHLLDEVGNFILEVTAQNQTIKSGITIASDILENYIREKYPDKFYFLESTTLGIEDTGVINEMTKSKYVIPSYTLNNKFDILDNIKDKSQIELLVAEYCSDNCPHRLIHYKSISRLQITSKWIDGKLKPTETIAEIAKIYGPAKCPTPKGEHPSEIEANDLLKLRKHNIPLEDIRSKYLPLGFNKFKISGRNLIDYSPHRIDRYCDYFVKDPYKDEVRDLLVDTCREEDNTKFLS